MDGVGAHDGDTLVIDAIKVTTRHARCVLGMPGLRIIEARRRPVFHRGEWVTVID